MRNRVLKNQDQEDLREHLNLFTAPPMQIKISSPLLYTQCMLLKHGWWTLTFAWASYDFQLGIAALGALELTTRGEGPSVGRAQRLALSTGAVHVALLVLVNSEKLKEKNPKSFTNRISFHFEGSIVHSGVIYAALWKITQCGDLSKPSTKDINQTTRWIKPK